jgi:ubiquinone biosynthesis protein
MAVFRSIRSRYRSFVRYNQILRVFVKYGFEELVSYMIASGRYRFIRRFIPKTTKKRAEQFTRWEKMRLVCEELGPTFIKFGQILSNRPDLLPDDLILEFEKLQDNVPPMSGEIAIQVVEKELKKPLTELFASFEKEAFASASIAQVHRVTLHTGEKVALKVQRPNIRSVIREDIKVLYQLATLFERRIPSSRSFDPVGLVRNFEESILRELDFIHESVNIQRFAGNIKSDPADKTTRSPGVYKEYTTSMVLAMEFMDGLKISNIQGLKAQGHDVHRIARKLAVSYVKQVFQYGFFHADPHPGNLLITPEGEVCFLDFGMMGNILPRDIEMFAHLFIAVKSEDLMGVVRALQLMSEATVINDLRGFEFAVNEFITSYSVSLYHQHEMSTILIELRDIIVKYGLKVPPHFFLLARSMVTIEGVIHHLDPKLDLMTLARPYIAESIRKEFDPLKIIRKILNGIYEFGSYMEEFPQDLRNAIRKINNGKVSVDLTHKGVDPVIHTMNRITRQMVTAIILAGLLIGSAMFIIREVEPKWHHVPVFAIYGIIAAAILGWGMLRDLRKGDHDDWPGWNHD